MVNGRSSARGPSVRRLLGLPAEPEVEPPFRMWTDDDGVLCLAGGMDGDSVGAVRAALRACDPSGRTVVDLSKLHFLDSAGLGCLLAQDDRMRREGGSLVLRHPGPTVLRVFQVSGALGRLTVEPAA